MIKGVSQREKAASWYRKFHVSDYVTLLHLPFSAAVVAFAVIGAAMAPDVYVGRLIPAVVAVFLAHQGSHYLDEIKGHPWGTMIPDSSLYAIGFSFLAVAMAIGIYLSLTVSLFLLAFMAAMIFFPISYGLELWRDRFHGPLSFGLSGALVCLGSFYLQSLTVTGFSVIMSAAIGVQSMYIIILYEKTKVEETRTLAWGVLKGIVVMWIFIALAFVMMRLAW